MRYLIGDLGNTANQLVLCSIITAFVMQFMCEVFRRAVIAAIGDHKKASTDLARVYARWAIGLQRGVPALLLMALLTQQIRLQAVKEIALREGLATATPVLSIRDFSTGGISGKTDQQDAFQVADKTIEVTTPNGTSVSVSLNGGSDWTQLRRPSAQRGGGSGGIRRSEERSGVCSDGTATLPGGRGLHGAIY